MSWEKVRLGDYLNVLSGFAFKSSLFTDDSSHTPIIRIRDIKRSYTETFYQGDYNPNYLIIKGDLVIGMDGEFNIAEWQGIPSLLNQRVSKISTQDTHILNEKYLFYVLAKYLKEIEDRTSFVTVKHLSVKDINNIEIPLPPLPVQEKIAAILDKADALRRKDQELLKKYDELAHAIFIDMFGDPVRNEKGWEVKRFDFFVSFDTIMTSDFEKYAHVPHIGVGNIERDSGRLIDYKLVKDENIKSGKYIFTSDHIIYSKIRPNLNKVALPTFEGLCSADSYPLLPTQNSNKYFFSYLLRSDHFLDFISSFSNRANIPKVNKEQLNKYFGIAPPLALQETFAKKIELINQLKAQTNTEKSEELFQSLLQCAFKGELVR